MTPKEPKPFSQTAIGKVILYFNIPAYRKRIRVLTQKLQAERTKASQHNCRDYFIGKPQPVMIQNEARLPDATEGLLCRVEMGSQKMYHEHRLRETKGWVLSEDQMNTWIESHLTDPPEPEAESEDGPDDGE